MPGARRSGGGCSSSRSIFALWTTAVQARLVWLQVHEHERLRLKAGRQPDLAHAARCRRCAARSSTAKDACSRPRPTPTRSTPSPPRSTTTRRRRASCARCSRAAPSSKEQLAALVEKLSKKRPFTYVKRQVSPEEAAAVGRPQARRRRPAQGEPPVLPDARVAGGGARLRRPRQQRAGRRSSRSTTTSSAARTDRRWCYIDAAPRVRQRQRAADRGCLRSS